MPAVVDASGGQLVDAPSQVSIASQRSAGGRHTVPDTATPSAGHTALVPSQCSATSQVPNACRHTVVVGATKSAGHAEPNPSHTSGASQASELARHTTPDPSSWQVPFEVAPAPTLQAWQSFCAPPQAVLQHTPSTQLPLVQIESCRHGLPSAAADWHVLAQPIKLLRNARLSLLLM
jgi:hypothetical protein